jgi:hypothetical protein
MKTDMEKEVSATAFELIVTCRYLHELQQRRKRDLQASYILRDTKSTAGVPRGLRVR